MSNRLRAKNKPSGIKWIPAGLFFLPVFFVFLYRFQFWTTALVLLSIIGILICISIVAYLLKLGDPIGLKLCSTEGLFDCDKVLNSSSAKITGDYTWGDVGLIYFCAQCLFLFISAVFGLVHEALFFFLLLATIAFSGTFFSIYFQWRVISGWCKMCLLTALTIWLQECLLLLYIKSILR